MKNKLLPIIAAYWECHCSWLNDWEKPERVYDIINDNSIVNALRSSFRVHLRNPNKITQKQLKELGKALGYPKPIAKVLKERSYVTDRDGIAGICFYNDRPFEVVADFNAVEAIDWLRQNGFCVNKALVDANLVEWI